LEHCTLAQ